MKNHRKTMSINKKWLLTHYLVVLLCFCCQFYCSTGGPNEENIFTQNGEKVLSRKRRYLVFPAGSSFQMVYDGIYPIVGYEKLFILGITVSMAWQLPSEPFYKTLETVLEKQKNLVKIDKPSVPSRIDDDSTKLQYIDSNGKNNFYHSSDNGYGGNKYYIDRTSDPDSTKYYTSDGYDKVYNKKTPTNIKYGYYGPQNWSKNDWVNIIQRFVKGVMKPKPHSQPAYQGRKMVYPIFGKRSVDQHSTAEDILHINHHRNTRHELYGKIEKFLKANGKDGKACVLKALCETEKQNDNDAGPGTFVQEILKAIFRLPRVGDGKENRFVEYDRAIAEIGDCSDKYPECEDSIFSPEFMF